MDTSLRHSHLSDAAAWTAGALAIAVDTIAESLTCGEVLRRFSADDRSPPSFAIETGTGFGLIDRVHCASILAQRFGRELYERKPVALIMDHHPLVVDAAMGIEEVGAAIADSKPAALQSGFIVVRDSMYVGVATGIDLLRATAAQTASALERLRSMQASLIESEKLASLGGLVGGIAHEINTPIGITLTAATQHLESLCALERRFEDSQIRKHDLARFIATSKEGANLIIGNAQRAAELVASFKQIAVDQVSDERRRFNLGEYTRDVLRSLRPRLKTQPVRVKVDVPDELSVDGYPGALSQVLTNLITNALLHAFGPGIEGTIEINARASGDSIFLSVADDGCGIAREHRDRVFEPFFTTKRGDGGSGLGLNIVYNIVTRSFGGRITVEDRPGGGTRFLMQFPRSLAGAASDALAHHTARFGNQAPQEIRHAAI